MTSTRTPWKERVGDLLAYLKIFALWGCLLLLVAGIVLWKPVMWLLLVLEVGQ